MTETATPIPYEGTIDDVALDALPEPRDQHLYSLDTAPLRNQQRGLYALEGLTTFGERVGILQEPVEMAVRDFLCNMRHLCDSLGLDLAHLDDMARQSYLDEIGGEG